MYYLGVFCFLFFNLLESSFAASDCWKQLVNDRRGQRLMLHRQADAHRAYQLDQGVPFALPLSGYALMQVAFAFSGNDARVAREGWARYYLADMHHDRASSSFVRWMVREKLPLTGHAVRDALGGLDGVFVYKVDRQGTVLLFDSVQAATEHEVTFGSRVTIDVRNLAEFVAVPSHIETKKGILYRD